MLYQIYSLSSSSVAADKSIEEHVQLWQKQLGVSANNIIDKLYKMKDTQSAYVRFCAHALVWKQLQLCYGIPSPPNYAYNEYGKPFFTQYPGFHFSISHSGSYIAAAFSNRPIGIDVQEHINLKNNLAKRVCSKAECQYLYNSSNFTLDFFNLWVLKESFVKAIGKGLAFSLNKICFSTTGSSIIPNQNGFLFSLHNPFPHLSAAICEKNV